jgi:hypothetical protein
MAAASLSPTWGCINNIIVDHTLAITLTAGNKVTLRQNLWHNNVKDWGGSGIVDDKGGHVRADPLFVNPDGNDYHLQAASPARDSGASNAGVAIDYDNQTRPADNGFDIGADEFVFTGIPTPLWRAQTSNLWCASSTSVTSTKAPRSPSPCPTK